MSAEIADFPGGRNYQLPVNNVRLGPRILETLHLAARLNVLDGHQRARPPTGSPSAPRNHFACAESSNSISCCNASGSPPTAGLPFTKTVGVLLTPSASPSA